MARENRRKEMVGEIEVEEGRGGRETDVLPKLEHEGRKCESKQ